MKIKRAIIYSVIGIFTMTRSLAYQTDIQPNLRDNLEKECVTEIKNRVDYSATKKVWMPKTSPRKNQIEPPVKVGLLAKLFANIVYYLLILAFIIACITLIVLLLSKTKSKNNDIPVETDVSEESGENIRALDLNTMLANALANDNYKLAIRAKFLILLKYLASIELIHWSIEKTNRDYSEELTHTTLFPNFKTSVVAFERAWYGNQVVNEMDYASASQLFQNIIDHQPENEPTI